MDRSEIAAAVAAERATAVGVGGHARRADGESVHRADAGMGDAGREERALSEGAAGEAGQSGEEKFDFHVIYFIITNFM